MGNKRIEKIIYGFMALLMLVQVIVPVVAVAETTDTDTGTITLTKAKLSGDAQNAFVDLEGKIQTKGQKLTEQLSVLEGTKFVPEANQSLGLKDANVSVEAEKLVFKAEANVNEAFTFRVKVDSSTIKDKLTIKIGQQEMNVEIPESLKETATSTSTSETNVDQTSVSSSESKTTGESATTATTASTTETSTVSEKETTKSSEEAVQKPAAGSKAATGNDIRDYFPNGEGTIIDSADVTYYDKEGNKLTPPVPADAEVRVHYEWSIPEDVREQIKAGD